MLGSLLVASAILSVLISGVNDGGAVLAPALREPRFPLIPAVGILVILVAIGPALFGTQVATTFARRLVPFDGRAGQIALVIGILASVAVVATLASRGLPTSLTLALVGGLTGAGQGAGLPVAWGAVGLVLVAGLLAPFLGAALAFLLSKGLVLLPPSQTIVHVAGRVHWLAFPLLAFAYAVNDGQKMLGILFAATQPSATAVRADPPLLAASALLFLIGLVYGLRRVGAALANRLLALRPLQLDTAQVATACTVIGSAVVGLPVSLTQSLAGAFIGTGVLQGYRRIRWQVVARIGLAWCFTLPASLGLAALAGWLLT